VIESDVRFYRRRANEEMAAARRAVTSAARDRRLKLVDLYVQRLEALNAPAPFDDQEFAAGLETSIARMGHRSAFTWRGAVNGSRN
jgi:hypothetical protein